MSLFDRFRRRVPRLRRDAISTPAIEPLEARIAPAMLVSPTTVSFLDKNGDAVTVVITKGLFTTANVSKVFTFDTGSFNGTTDQQLELLNITKLGPAAAGIGISITATPVSGSSGIVDVGFINASGIDLGTVNVAGDLGRINAGDLALSSTGLHSLTVDSIGARGLVTQLPNGNLSSRISGGVGSIIINGDLDGSIGIGGGAKGTLGSLTVTGSINGGPAEYSGSVRAQGLISNVTIDGSIIGGSGPSSGIIGTAGGIGMVTVGGSVVGGGGTFSGGILSTRAIQSVKIDGDLTGGMGMDSGQVGTASNLQTVTVEMSVEGGAGPLSGVILATGNITTVNISEGLIGGAGIGSGQVGSGASIGAVTIGGYMAAGAEIHAFQNIQSVSVNPGDNSLEIHPLDVYYSPGISNSFVVADNGAIGSITAGNITNSGFNAGGSIGAVNATDSINGSVFVAGISLGANFGVGGAGTFNNASAASFGFGSSKSAIAAHIGSITVGGAITQSTFLAGVHGSGVDKMFGSKDDSVATGSSIGAIVSPYGLNTDFLESGNIGATNSGAILDTTYISTDTAVSAGGIGPLSIIAQIFGIEDNLKPALAAQLSTVTGDGIDNSMFISNAGIGPINITLNGTRIDGENAGISSSSFLAGHALGTITVTDNASGTAGYNYGIYMATFEGGIDGYGGTGDISVTLTDAGPDGNSAAIAHATFDASVCACMSANMGSIYAENADTDPTAAGILDSTFRVHGNIGPISATMDSGLPMAAAIEGSTFSAFGSIGDINVYGAVLPDGNVPSRFLAGYDIGKNLSFNQVDLSAKSLALQNNQSVGNVTVTGYFEGSDIAASVNPGSTYVFGADSNTGTTGSIGLVNIGTNVTQDDSPFVSDGPAQHGIEAGNFALGEGSQTTVIAFGFTAEVPVILYVDGGANDVRITNFTQPADT